MKPVYLTFSTDEKTSKTLKFIAEKEGMTQPELINQICKDFIGQLEIFTERELKEKSLG